MPNERFPRLRLVKSDEPEKPKTPDSKDKNFSILEVNADSIDAAIYILLAFNYPGVGVEIKPKKELGNKDNSTVKVQIEDKAAKLVRSVLESEVVTFLKMSPKSITFHEFAGVLEAEGAVPVGTANKIIKGVLDYEETVEILKTVIDEYITRPKKF